MSQLGLKKQLTLLSQQDFCTEHFASSSKGSSLDNFIATYKLAISQGHLPAPCLYSLNSSNSVSAKAIAILSFLVDHFFEANTTPPPEKTQKNNLTKKKKSKPKEHHKTQRKLLGSSGIDGKPSHKHLIKLHKLITDSFYFKLKLHYLKPLGSHLLFVFKEHHNLFFHSWFPKYYIDTIAQ